MLVQHQMATDGKFGHTLHVTTDSTDEPSINLLLFTVIHFDNALALNTQTRK